MQMTFSGDWRPSSQFIAERWREGGTSIVWQVVRLLQVCSVSLSGREPCKEQQWNNFQTGVSWLLCSRPFLRDSLRLSGGIIGWNRRTTRETKQTLHYCSTRLLLLYCFSTFVISCFGTKNKNVLFKVRYVWVCATDGKHQWDVRFIT